MQVNFSTVLTDLHGNPLKRQKDGDASQVEDMTAGAAACDALLAPDQNDKDGKRKVQLFTLALRVANGGVQTVEAAEIVLIKDKVAAAYAPIVVGRMEEVLESPVAEK